MNRHLQQKAHSGAVLVEFALVLPVLCLFFLGTIHFGYAFRAHQILQNAVREGARFASLPDPNATEEAIKNYVIDYCRKADLKPDVSSSEITVIRTYEIVIDENQTVLGSQVSIDHPHPLLFGGAMLPIGGALTLHASVVFRNMY